MNATSNLRGANLRSERFRSPWPGVLIEIKDYLDLSFLALGTRRGNAVVRVLISKALVPQQQLQPHMAKFRVALVRIPDCRVEIGATEEAWHSIEIECGR